MRKLLATWLAGAALVVASSLGAASSANAGVVTFGEITQFGCDFNTSPSYGGMVFASTWSKCGYAAADSADFPTPIHSSVLGVGYSDLTLTTNDASAFSLNSVDLAFGPFGHMGLLDDTTLVTGFLEGGGSVSRTLHIGFGFQRYSFGADWANLSSVVFGQLPSTEYIGFDNIAYNGGIPPALDAGVPEPATWGLMIIGFMGVGAMLRSTRRKAALA